MQSAIDVNGTTLNSMVSFYEMINRGASECRRKGSCGSLVLIFVVHVVLAVGLLAHLAPFSKEQNFCLDSRQPWQMNNLRRQTMAQFANSPLGWLSTHCHSRTTCVLPERASEWVKCRRGAIDSLS
jgi:hypothetical protein